MANNHFRIFSTSLSLVKYKSKPWWDTTSYPLLWTWKEERKEKIKEERREGGGEEWRKEGKEGRGW